MSDRASGHLVKILVEGRAPEPFFQVLVVCLDEPSERLAEAAARAFLCRLGATFTALDSEETMVVPLGAPPLAWILPVPSPEGIFAASGRIYALEEETDP